MSFFINEITASDAGPDIIRSHLFFFEAEIEKKIKESYNALYEINSINVKLIRIHLYLYCNKNECNNTFSAKSQ